MRIGKGYTQVLWSRVVISGAVFGVWSSAGCQDTLSPCSLLLSVSLPEWTLSRTETDISVRCNIENVYSTHKKLLLRERERERERGETCVRISNCPTTCCNVLESCGVIDIGSRGVVWGGTSSLPTSCTCEEWGSEVWGCAGCGLWNSRGPMLVIVGGAVRVSRGRPVTSN